MSIKREYLARTLNPVPDFIGNEEDLNNYYTAFFHDLSVVLGHLEHSVISEEDAVPIDFDNQLQMLSIRIISKLVRINKRIQKHTAPYLKKNLQFEEIAYAR